MTKSIKEKIDVLVLSDIHLGDNTLHYNDLLQTLKRYDAKKIILNGDILNGLKFQRLHTSHWKILSILRDLSKNHDVIWVHGNHDADEMIISNLLGFKSVNKYSWEMHGQKFLAIHGHQFDQFLNNNFIFSQIIFIIHDQLKKKAFSRYLLNYFKKNNQTWQRNSEGIANGALQLARLVNANYVFCGHSHQIMEKEKNGIKYFNTGTWVDGLSGYVTITNGDVVLHRI